MDAREHYLEGEHHLAEADGRSTYSDAAIHHTTRALAHFSASVASSLLAGGRPDRTRALHDPAQGNGTESSDA